MPAAIACLREAFTAQATGKLVCPPRHEVAFGPHGALVFTVGGSLQPPASAGFRVYTRFPQDEQLVVVYDPGSGALLGVVAGSALGALRTGAIGGLACDLLARPDATRVGLIGSGAQAATQLEAIAAVRPLTEVRVSSRTPTRREAFAADWSARLGIPVRAVASAAEALEDAQIAVLATNSGQPVIDAAMVAPGCHVTTLGPKLADRHECDPALAGRAGCIASDSLAQLLAYRKPFFLADTPHFTRIRPLSSILVGEVDGRASPEEITLFCSVGLAGTEVVLARMLLAG